MSKKRQQEVSILLANPSGNVTIFVLTPTPQSSYTDIANKLLQLKQFKAEQVCFIKDVNFQSPIQGTMAMSGLEFCGNASRSFALLIAKEQGITGQSTITVSVSGANNPLAVSVDTTLNLAEISMPRPKTIETLTNQPLECLNQSSLIEFDGITHLILTDIPADQNIFNSIKEIIMKTINPSALGVMFYNSTTNSMTPIVYVRDIDTTYWEGSCASGTTALCIYLSKNYSEGKYTYSISQPDGKLIAHIEKSNNKIRKLSIDGIVSLGEVQTVIV